MHLLALSWKFWVATLLILAFLPFILGFISSMTVNWARKAAERNRPCPRCKSAQNLVFYEGIRPGVRMKEIKTLIFDIGHRLYQCRNCEAKLIVNLRGHWRDATPEEWENATKTRAMYERVDAMRRGFGDPHPEGAGEGEGTESDGATDPDDSPAEDPET